MLQSTRGARGEGCGRRGRRAASNAYRTAACCGAHAGTRLAATRRVTARVRDLRSTTLALSLASRQHSLRTPGDRMFTGAATVDPRERVAEFAPLVRRMARQLYGRLPASVQIDDIIQAGMIGL